MAIVGEILTAKPEGCMTIGLALCVQRQFSGWLD